MLVLLDKNIYQNLLKELEEDGQKINENILDVYGKRLDSCLLNTIITSINIELPAQDTDFINFGVLKNVCMNIYQL